MRNALQKVASLSDRYQPLATIRSILIELNDLAEELNQSLEQLEANPMRLEEINGRTLFERFDEKASRSNH